MMNFLTENIGTIIVCLILLAIVALAVRHLVVNKKKGKTSCGCGCANCPSAGICHGAKK
ncbi:MAG: FeoB-associated Cys-rich membrane protein [Clostridia bacterium]|nr:FeoB-associated Cys-rich membrane protein [Clostridia bacterium]